MCMWSWCTTSNGLCGCDPGAQQVMVYVDVILVRQQVKVFVYVVLVHNRQRSMFIWSWCTTSNSLCVCGHGAQVMVFVYVVLVYNK